MMLMARLKEATRQRHEEVEARMPVLDPGLPLPGYARLLRQLQTVVEPLEAQLLERSVPAAFRLKERLKAPLLARDLAALPASPSLPPLAVRLTGLPEALGALYVLEGSTLGGQVIGRHLRARGLTPARGGAYFHAYGPETGAMWRAFSEAMNGWEGEPERVIAGANLTFGAFADVLRPVPA